MSQTSISPTKLELAKLEEELAKLEEELAKLKVELARREAAAQQFIAEQTIETEKAKLDRELNAVLTIGTMEELIEAYKEKFKTEPLFVKMTKDKNGKPVYSETNYKLSHLAYTSNINTESSNTKYISDKIRYSYYKRCMVLVKQQAEDLHEIAEESNFVNNNNQTKNYRVHTEDDGVSKEKKTAGKPILFILSGIWSKITSFFGSRPPEDLVLSGDCSVNDFSKRKIKKLTFDPHTTTFATIGHIVPSRNIDLLPPEFSKTERATICVVNLPKIEDIFTIENGEEVRIKEEDLRRMIARQVEDIKEQYPKFKFSVQVGNQPPPILIFPQIPGMLVNLVRTILKKPIRHVPRIALRPNRKNPIIYYQHNP